MVIDTEGESLIEKKRGLKWLGGTIASILGLSTRLNLEFCERGISAGSYVFCYGLGKKVLTKENVSEVLSVEYLATSVDLMKGYLKEKLFRNVVLAGAALAVVGISGFFLWMNFKKGIIRLLQKESGIKIVESGADSQQSRTDYITKHYPLYMKNRAIRAVRCGCGRNVKNVVNFPCCHIGTCLCCYVERPKKTCDVCHSDVYDIFVLSLV